MKNNIVKTTALLLTHVLLAAAIAADWKTGLAITATVYLFGIAWYVVNRKTGTANATEAGSALAEMPEPVIYDGIPDSIDWD